MTPKAGDDATAQACLEMLRSGTHAEKITARLTLAEIFERREQYAEAVELLETCRAQGFEDAELHESLKRLYRSLGDIGQSDAAARRAMRLRKQAIDLRKKTEPRRPSVVITRVVAFVIALAMIGAGIGLTWAGHTFAVFTGTGRFLIFYGLVLAGGLWLFQLTLVSIFDLIRYILRRR